MPARGEPRPDGRSDFDVAVRPALDRYRELLLAAAAAFNLTALRDAEAVERRLLAESLRVAALLAEWGLLPGGAAVIDVGSGGGLPGMPLAIARADVAVTLLEATGKKAEFLRRVVEELALANVRVLGERAETAAHVAEEREGYDLAVARAVAPLAALAELTLPFVRLGGAVAAVKGARAEDEVVEAKAAIARCGGGEPRIVEAGEGKEAVRLVLLPKVRPTPAELPRRPGMPMKRPLR